MNVLLIDDHPILRRGLATLLARGLAGLTTVECSSGTEAISHLESDALDLVVMDLGLPDCDGMNLLQLFRNTRPQVPVLVLSMHEEDQFAVRTLRLGASGYLTKDKAADKLVEAVQTILAGGKYVSEALAQQLASALNRVGGLPHDALSKRELEVLLLLARGKTVKEIGLELGLSIKTISAHRTRLLGKLQLRTSADLVRYALKAGLLRREPQ